MAAFIGGGLVEQINITATAAGTTTLVGSTSSSATLGKQIQIFTGSSTQTVVLPDATTMIVGQKFEIYNESSLSLSIQFNGGASFVDASGVNYGTLLPHTTLIVKLQTNGTSAGTWAVISTSSTSGTGINYITYGNAEAGTQGWHTVNWQQSVTITNASPAVFAVTSTTGMYIGMPISFTTTGALPTGLTASTIYFISSIPSGSTFQVSATLGGTAVNTSSAGSGTHTSYPLVPINDTTVALSNLTFTTSSSGPLVGANSYTLVQTNSKAVGGQGSAYDFTIDSAYQAQILSINVNYNASSTFVASSGSVGSDSDIEFAIWDKTNSVLIPVTPKFVTGNGVNNFVFNGSFQTASNSTSYALIVFCPTMNANAIGWTFKFDNVQVGPSITALISSSTVVASYYLSTNQAVTANNPVKYDTKLSDASGSYSTTTGLFTVPSSGQYIVSGSGATTTSTSGWYVQKNSTKLSYLFTNPNSSPSGGATIVNCVAGDTLQVNLDSSLTAAGGAAPYFTSVNFALIGNSPGSTGINGAIAARYTGATASITSSYSNVTFTTNSVDTNGAYSGNTLIVPTSGIFDFGGQLFISGTASLNGTTIVGLSKNGTIISESDFTYAGAVTGSVGIPFNFGSVQCISGDLIVIQVKSSITLPVITASSTENFFSYSLISGNNNGQSANNPRSYVFVYGGTSGASGIGSSSTWVRRFLSVDTNIGGAITYNDSATLGGTFTINQSGIYTINYNDLAGTGETLLVITKNSTTLSAGAIAFSVGTMSDVASAKYGTATATIPLSAGDVIRAQDANTNSRGSDATRGIMFSICKVD